MMLNRLEQDTRTIERHSRQIQVMSAQVLRAQEVLSEKFGVTTLPEFALRQGTTKISGILGMDTLYMCQAIIDLDGMNLFLK